MIWLIAAAVVSVVLALLAFAPPTRVQKAPSFGKTLKASKRESRGQVRPGTEAYRRMQSRERMSKRSRCNNYRLRKGHQKV